MTRIVVVTCDGCGEEIPTTAYFREDYLALVPMPRLHKDGISHYPEQRRLLRDELHFCNFRCLDEWSERRP